MQGSAVRNCETQRPQDTAPGVFDGDDFLTENPFARQYGEAKILEISEGTPDVQLTADVRGPESSA